ncbi:MAG: c-type cytochrome [Acidobacteria bacterium]|nr:c-type cytochrome [Acidobacteriota bacterium]
MVTFFLLTLAILVCLLLLVYRGFRATTEPLPFESAIARRIRDLAIPRKARRETNPLPASAENLQAGRELFLARCANCHGIDGNATTSIGRSLYPRAPNLSSRATQSLTDGEIHYIIENGVQLTGMPAWDRPHLKTSGIWQLLIFIRNMRPLMAGEEQAQTVALSSAHYIGSQACRTCHREIYDRWKRTPMANVVRDPREHPEALISDLATNRVAKFTVDQIAFVYGSLWKQRYFTKVGADYYPLGAQWEVKNHVWSKYFVRPGTDWWAQYYPPNNMARPTGPTCDGCHSVGYDIRTKQVAEWNVGCERCHGPASEHAAHPTQRNIFNPSRTNYVAASDTCIQCHSQGRPLTIPIEGKYYDWPVGYRVGERLQDYWKLEEPTLGRTDFYYFADGTAHKNRMQGNDFVQSIMYRRGITCFSCHDVHGTNNYAQLTKPADRLCLDCHAPLSPNGPRTATLEEHTHHKPGSAGSQCIVCHMPLIESEGPANTFVHAHTFRFISPQLADQYGIPNPCTSCHKDKSTTWATKAIKNWPERSPWRLQLD